MPQTKPGAASTTPKRRQRHQPQPVSATVAKLLAQIHAEAEASTLAALSEKDGILVLAPMAEGPKTVQVYRHGVGLIVTSAGCEFRMYRDHCNDHGSLHWHPAHWFGTEVRVDGAGRRWSSTTGTHVTDDFGNLVEVPA